MRGDFNQQVKETLAKRVGYRCSSPHCRKLTSGPHEEPTKVVNIGVAAHTTAAAPGSPRYNPKLSSEERKAIANDIWLCQSCSKLIDSDEQKYSVQLLLDWKSGAEAQAATEIENSNVSMPPVNLAERFKSYLHALSNKAQAPWLSDILVTLTIQRGTSFGYLQK